MKERSFMPYDVVAFEADDLAMQFSLIEEALFHRMLRRAWMNGSVPADMKALALICRVHLSTLKKAWPRIAPLWNPHPSLEGRLINQKLERERDYKEQKTNQAREAAEKRWKEQKEKEQAEANNSHPSPGGPINTHVSDFFLTPGDQKTNQITPAEQKTWNERKTKENSDANALPTQCDRNASYPHPHPHPDPKKEEEEKRNTLATDVAGSAVKYSDDFEEFWKTSTRRGSKKYAFDQWKRLRPDQGLRLEISDAMTRWQASEQWQDETKQPHIHGWLKRRGWEEIIPQRSNGNGIEQRNAEAARRLLSRRNPQNSGGFSSESRGGRTGNLSRAIAPAFSGPDADGDESHD